MKARKKESIPLEQPILPGDLVNIALGYLGIEQSELPNQCSIHDIEATLKCVLEKWLAALLLHVVRNEQDEAEMLLKKNPELLFQKGTVVDYSNRTFYLTAFQCALWALDVEMCKMMLPYFENGWRGEKEALKQFDEQWSKKKKGSHYHFSKLIGILSNPSDDAARGQEMEKTLKEFRVYCEINNNVKGRHFDFLFIQRACKRYEKYDHFEQPLDSVFMELYWCWVVGFLQRFLPAWFARRVCHTLEERVLLEEKKERLPLKMSNNGKYRDVFFPLDTNRKRRLGYDFSLTESGVASDFLPFDSSFTDDLDISFKNATNELDALRRQLKKAYDSSSARLDDEGSESKSTLSCCLLL